MDDNEVHEYFVLYNLLTAGNRAEGRYLIFITIEDNGEKFVVVFRYLP